jgi:hypothetical protein
VPQILQKEVTSFAPCNASLKVKAMTKRTPQLSIIGPPPMPTTPPPPRHLDEIGRQLWSQITEQFEWSDRGSDEVLAQLCAARQRAERCIRIIDEQGEMLTMRGQIKAHPLLREELANRAFVVRSLAKLGLDLEPLRPGPWSTAWGAEHANQEAQDRGDADRWTFDRSPAHAARCGWCFWIIGSDEPPPFRDQAEMRQAWQVHGARLLAEWRQPWKRPRAFCLFDVGVKWNTSPERGR